MPEEDSDDLLLRVEHGAKMILLMEILKECEILGDKVQLSSSANELLFSRLWFVDLVIWFDLYCKIWQILLIWLLYISREK